MKTKIAGLLVVIMMLTTQCMAQKTITVEAQSSDISNNLDLQAVASAFGESSNLEDFERRLNDYNNGISNLDLNNDGEVDYLRVIESYEDNVHVIVIQAVLNQDVYQDVATIVVDKNQNNRSYVQVIGDPYLFGNNYIIDPVYVYTPSIFGYLWSSRYSSWHSPYYWGYYPNYYRNRRPYDIDRYYSHIQSHINHNDRYYYSNRVRNDYYVNRIHSSISRNDYATRHPDRSFSKRNENIQNKNQINSRNALPTRQDNRNNESNRRNTSPTWTGGESPRSVNSSRDSRSQDVNRGSRDVQNRTNSVNGSTRNTNTWQNSNSTRNQPNSQSSPAPVMNRSNTDSRNNSYQQRNNNNTAPVRTETRTTTRESNNSRQAPAVSQPTRTSEPKQVERRSSENRSSESRQESRPASTRQESTRDNSSNESNRR